MKLGLLTDIHESIHNLRIALEKFESERVDQIIVLGDIFEMGESIEETCRLLQQADAIGVWGNHDYGLCVDPYPETLDKYSPSVFSYAQTLKPRLQVEDCYFSHIEPWLNPEELADLWYFHGLPDEDWKRKRIFEAAPNRLMFMGHYHRWLVVTSEEIRDWNGQTPIDLSCGQYMVVIDAILKGSFAIYDTEAALLTPFNQA
ncbi:metallophosphoesterase family protein [bacterium]|nr:metallophosphoesterase family protein [bacterium]